MTEFPMSRTASVVVMVIALGEELTVDPITGVVLVSEFAFADPLERREMNATAMTASVLRTKILLSPESIRLYRLTSLDLPPPPHTATETIATKST